MWHPVISGDLEPPRWAFVRLTTCPAKKIGTNHSQGTFKIPVPINFSGKGWWVFLGSMIHHFESWPSQLPLSKTRPARNKGFIKGLVGTKLSLNKAGRLKVDVVELRGHRHMVLVFVPSQKLRELAQQGKAGADAVKGEGQVEVLPRKLSCPPNKGPFQRGISSSTIVFFGEYVGFQRGVICVSWKVLKSSLQGTNPWGPLKEKLGTSPAGSGDLLVLRRIATFFQFQMKFCLEVDGSNWRTCYEGRLRSEKKTPTNFLVTFPASQKTSGMSRLILLPPVPGGCEQLRVQAPLSYWRAGSAERSLIRWWFYPVCCPSP